jgi:hypothetical protein
MQSDSAQAITRGGLWFLALWAAGILLLFGICGTLSVQRLREYRDETLRLRKASIESLAVEPAARPGAAGAGTGAPPVLVQVGMSLDRISEIDPKEGGWTADFHIWFRWVGDGVDPGRHFQLANGRILEREELMAYSRAGERFARYRVSARLTKTFDAARAPLGDQAMSIQVEDAVDGAERLRYRTAERDVDVLHVMAPPGLRISNSLATATLRSVGTARRDPGSGDGGAALHSVFVLAMVVKSPVAWTYVRMFQALFASVAISMIVFFIKPTHVDPRFGLPVGAFFAAVGNNISVVSMMPETGQVTLVQMINAAGMTTIFLTLVQSAISLYLLDTRGRERLQQTFDRVSFVVLGGCYLVLNVVLPLAARS